MKKYEKSPLFKMTAEQKKARDAQRRIYKRMAHHLARLERDGLVGAAVELDLKMNRYRRQGQHSKEHAEEQVKHMAEHYQRDAERVSIYKTLWARKSRAEHHGNQQLADLIDGQMDAFRKINKHDPEYRAKMVRRKRILHKLHNARYETKNPNRRKIQRERMKKNPRTRGHYYRKVRHFSKEAYQRTMADPVRHARREVYIRRANRYRYHDLKAHHPEKFARYKARHNQQAKRYMNRLKRYRPKKYKQKLQRNRVYARHLREELKHGHPEQYKESLKYHRRYSARWNHERSRMYRSWQKNHPDGTYQQWRKLH